MWLLLVILAVAVVGCSDGTAPADSESEGGGDDADMYGDEYMGAEGAPAPAPGKSPPADSPKDKEEEKPVAAPAPKTPLPESFADWTDEDFVRAKRTRDPRISEGVAFLGQERTGDPKAAQLLAKLLETREDPEPKPEPKKRPKLRSGSSEEYGEDYSGAEADEEMSSEDYEEMYSQAYEEEEAGMSRDEYEKMYSEQYEGQYDGSSRSGRRGGPKGPLEPGYVGLIGEIVRALGANVTDVSRGFLEQLLAGKLDTGDDLVSTNATFQALADFPSQGHDDILFKAFVTPEEYRPASAEAEKSDAKDQITAESLRAAAMPLVEARPSMELRIKLAQYLYVTGSPSSELRPLLEEIVATSHPYNVEAQVRLYGWDKTEPETKDEFERYFTTYNSVGLAWVLGVSPFPEKAETPPDRRGTGRPRTYGEEYDTRDEMEETERAYEEMYSEEMDGDQGGREGPRIKAPKVEVKPDTESQKIYNQVAAENREVVYEIMGQFLAPGFERAIAGRLTDLLSLEDATGAFMLGCTIPTDAMRKKLHQILQEHWQDGPDFLAGAPVYFDNGAYDPGLLVLLKKVPRKEPRRVRTTRPRRGGSGDYSSDYGSEYGRESSRSQPAESAADLKPEHMWMMACYGTVDDLCNRFRAAAENEGMRRSEVMSDPPLEQLHKDARVVAAYRLDWQKHVGARFSGASVDPLEVYYVRIEEPNRFSTVDSFYNRQVRSASRRVVQEGVWIDGTQQGSQPGRRRSVDVLIRRTEKEGDERTTETEPLVIEILWIEINDPAGATET